MGTDRHGEPDVLDLAVIGAGAAGTYVAERAQRAHPAWTIALFERTDRVGGRLRSMHVPGLDHPIELGGMRYLTSHRRVTDVVTRFALPTHGFDPTGGVERSFLRGRFGKGSGDPSAGGGYDLPDRERGRSAVDLVLAAFDAIVPAATAKSADDWIRLRAEGEYLGRPLTDWGVGEAVATTLSEEGHRFVSDAFGYDSGFRVLNVGDAIEYLVGAGDPSAEARVPDDGMDAIPRAMAAAFTAAGGSIRLGHEVTGLDLGPEGHRLRFAYGAESVARRIVVATPLPASSMLAGVSPDLGTPAVRRILESVEAFPAVKVYLWYDRPWWSGEGAAIRLTTDLPLRKLFYFGSDPERPAALLATYTDGRDSEPWRRLADGSGTAGSPAPEPMLAEIERHLRSIHPSVAAIPHPTGSAISSWGSDPHETGWHYWRSGFSSDEVIRAAIQPIPGVDVFLCGEAFSRAQAWVEGALETAEAVVERLG